MDRLRERDNRCRNKEEEGRETDGASKLAVSELPVHAQYSLAGERRNLGCYRTVTPVVFYN